MMVPVVPVVTALNSLILSCRHPLEGGGDSGDNGTTMQENVTIRELQKA
jgi:hypothetical protein